MSLEAASASRKAKLDLLRKRKADEEAGVAAPSRAIAPAGSDEDEDMGAAVKRSFRNFDPNSRQAKKHRQEVLDTIEKDVQGVQERIIKEDELKRKEELVSVPSGWHGLARPGYSDNPFSIPGFRRT